MKVYFGRLTWFGKRAEGVYLNVIHLVRTAGKWLSHHLNVGEQLMLSALSVIKWD